jgi:hypothetical protein
MFVYCTLPPRGPSAQILVRDAQVAGGILLLTGPGVEVLGGAVPGMADGYSYKTALCRRLKYGAMRV